MKIEIIEKKPQKKPKKPKNKTQKKKLIFNFRDSCLAIHRLI